MDKNAANKKLSQFTSFFDNILCVLSKNQIPAIL